mgnify:CR=1 FL=1
MHDVADKPLLILVQGRNVLVDEGFRHLEVEFLFEVGLLVELVRNEGSPTDVVIEVHARVA